MQLLGHRDPAILECGKVTLVKKHLAQLLTLAFLVAGCSSRPVPENTNSENGATKAPTKSTAPRSGREVRRLSGLVVAVIDGDTIDVFDENDEKERVRLHAVDAPERGKPFSKVSRRNLTLLVGGKNVTYDYLYRDREKRIVGKVFVDNLDVGLEQVKAGLAWHFKNYEQEQSEEDRKLYAESEQEARSQKRGLWQDPSLIPPWIDRGGDTEQPSKAHPSKKDANKNAKPNGSGSSNRPRGQDDASSKSAQSPASAVTGQIIGNKRSMIYHWPGCPDYHKISKSNRMYFNTPEEAEKAGYRRARNCE